MPKQTLQEKLLATAAKPIVAGLLSGSGAGMLSGVLAAGMNAKDLVLDYLRTAAYRVRKVKGVNTIRVRNRKFAGGYDIPMNGSVAGKLNGYQVTAQNSRGDFQVKFPIHKNNYVTVFLSPDDVTKPMTQRKFSPTSVAYDGNGRHISWHK